MISYMAICVLRVLYMSHNIYVPTRSIFIQFLVHIYTHSKFKNINIKLTKLNNTIVYYVF